jgi:hypothetical protein
VTEGLAPGPVSGPGTDPEPVPPPPGPPTRGDRVLLAAFALYAALLLLAAYAQLTDDRALLDLFDFRRLFTD